MTNQFHRDNIEPRVLFGLDGSGAKAKVKPSSAPPTNTSSSSGPPSLIDSPRSSVPQLTEAQLKVMELEKQKDALLETLSQSQKTGGQFDFEAALKDMFVGCAKDVHKLRGD